jgi:hypothetical protein
MCNDSTYDLGDGNCGSCHQRCFQCNNSAENNCTECFVNETLQ